MPQKQEAEQKTPLKNELAREHVESLPPDQTKTAQQSIQTSVPKPMFLDPKHDTEIASLLQNGIRAFTQGKAIEKCTTFVKLEALVYAMRDPDYFGFKYNPNSPNSPKTVEETYTSREGNCIDLSAVYIILAQKFGISGLSQFYVNFREKNTGEEEGHAALFFVEGRAMYIDPAFNQVYFFDKKFTTAEAAVKDKQFQNQVMDFRRKATGSKGAWEINDIGAITGPTSAEGLYYFEMGVRASNEKRWLESIDHFQKAIENGVRNSITYFGIGQAYESSGQPEKAIEPLEKAVGMKADPAYYYSLGRAYSASNRPDKYELAASAFRNQLKYDKKNVQAMYDLGISCNNAAEAAMERKDYEKAFLFYVEAGHVLTRVSFFKPNEFEEAASQLLKSIMERKREVEKELTK